MTSQTHLDRTRDKGKGREEIARWRVDVSMWSEASASEASPLYRERAKKQTEV